jgi:predicted PurR-regulated permease PerM
MGQGALMVDRIEPNKSALQHSPTRRQGRGDLFGGSFHDDWRYARRVVITVVVVGLAYFLWLISGVLLLIFAAILLAVLFNAFARLIARYTPVPEGWALTTAVLIVAVLVVGFLVLFGAQVSGQVAAVLQRLPGAIEAGGTRLGISDAFEKLEEAVTSAAGSNVVSRVTGVGYTMLGALADLALVIVAAVYLAADPRLYRHGAAKLLPATQHGRVFDAMDATATALRLWFAGQLVTMVLVGTVSGAAFWWIGLPSPLALGIIAGVTNFVPFLGPFLGAIPALIFALAQDARTVFWTIGAVFVIQQLEGNVITPLIQRRAVSMPPVLALFAIVVFGLLFGLPGIFLAVPLAVALLVLVKKLWVRQTLGEETTVPGEDDGEAQEAASPSSAEHSPH